MWPASWAEKTSWCQKQPRKKAEVQNQDLWRKKRNRLKKIV
jgi:hypothetical protein